MTDPTCRVVGTGPDGSVAVEVSWVEPVPCRFCGSPAVAVFALDAGCACFPGDRRQALCMQHVVRASPVGSMELAEDLTAGGAFAAWWLS